MLRRQKRKRSLRKIRKKKMTKKKIKMRKNHLHHLSLEKFSAAVESLIITRAL